MDGKTLGTYVAEQRMRLCLAQRELAKLLHVSVSTISRIEDDAKIRPDRLTLRKMAEIFQCDYDYLLTLSEKAEVLDGIWMLRKSGMKMTVEQAHILTESFDSFFAKGDIDKEVTL